jgi:hypothetical protein
LADQLANIRVEIKQPEIREAKLRAQLLAAGDADRRGVQWQASVRTLTYQKIDTKAAIKYFGEAALAPCPVTSQNVSLRRVKNSDQN